jgi:N-methylhydantoinase A/oxoprolinase/acetone carboxylase beta subunit
VTDAHLTLGRLPARIAARVELDVAAAAASLGDLDPSDVVRAVDAELVRALRVMSVERGHDPRSLALVAFGGAGPLHACTLAEELEIATVLIPETAGVLSAVGLAAGERRRDRVQSHLAPLAGVSGLPEAGEADVRYSGQSFELTVPLGGGPDQLAERFHRAHEQRYGHADRSRTVELVAVRTADVEPGPPLDLGAAGGPPATVAGPAVLELDGSTAWIGPGWVGARDGGTWVVTRA